MDKYRGSHFWHACDELAAMNGGRTPTYEEIRSHVGSGSNSTIKPIRKAWERERRQSNGSVPPLSDALSGAVNDVWAKLCLEAQQQVVAAQAKAAQKLNEQSEKHSVISANLKQEILSQKRRNDLLAGQLDSARQQISQQQAYLVQYQADREAEIKRMQLSIDRQEGAFNRELGRLRDLLTEKGQVLEQSQRALAAAERREAVAISKLENSGRETASRQGSQRQL